MHANLLAGMVVLYGLTTTPVIMLVLLVLLPLYAKPDVMTLAHKRVPHLSEKGPGMFASVLVPDTRSKIRTHSYRLPFSNAEGACKTTRDSDFANPGLIRGNNDCNTPYSCNV